MVGCLRSPMSALTWSWSWVHRAQRPQVVRDAAPGASIPGLAPRSCAGGGARRRFQRMGWQCLQPLLLVVRVADLISPVRKLGCCWAVFEVYFEFLPLSPVLSSVVRRLPRERGVWWTLWQYGPLPDGKQSPEVGSVGMQERCVPGGDTLGYCAVAAPSRLVVISPEDPPCPSVA